MPHCTHYATQYPAHISYLQGRGANTVRPGPMMGIWGQGVTVNNFQRPLTYRSGLAIF